jgi:hypothetical protein
VIFRAIVFSAFQVYYPKRRVAPVVGIVNADSRPRAPDSFIKVLAGAAIEPIAEMRES